jgi:hypothetical protein
MGKRGIPWSSARAGAKVARMNGLRHSCARRETNDTVPDGSREKAFEKVIYQKFQWEAEKNESLRFQSWSKKNWTSGWS